MIETSVNPLNMKNIFLKNRSIENMKPKAQIQNQVIIKINGAQSSIKRRPIPLKDINSRA
jgi:hypothetical protein